MEKDFDEYEKDYLERLRKDAASKKKESDKDWAIRKRAELEEQENFKKMRSEALSKLGRIVNKPLEPLDFMILKLLQNHTDTAWGVTQKLEKVNAKKLEQHLNELTVKGYLIDGENKSWWARNVSPKIKVSDEGKKILDEKFEELKTQWLEIEMQFKSKDKNKLKNSLLANNSMLPLFMMMGFTNGMMMGQMMALTDMNYQMMTQGMDYAYLDGYTDGFYDGGGDGGFMDGEFQPGF